MPVPLAATEAVAVARSEFDLRGVSATTTPDAASVVTVAPVEDYSGIPGTGQSREGFL